VDVTVSIVNHENRDAVLDGLEALTADPERRREVEIIVVDNASQDGSVEAIRGAFPDAQVIGRHDRAGYGANHNVALRRARGRYALLLNDDVQVQPGAINALCDHLDAYPDVAVAAPAVRTPHGTPEPTLWPRPSLRVDLRGALHFGRPPIAPAGGPIGWVTGCALMVRRDAVMAIGGFDEAFFMYSEEIDLCTRVLDAGHRIVHVPEAVVVHEGQVSTGADSPERAVEMARARRRYWSRHYRPAACLAARLIVGLQFLALAAAAAVRGRAARPLLLQAAICFRDLGRPGLRERAEAFNRGAPEPSRISSPGS
jgi:N-acetylglucosaminyl-diphospho-decaprenol L-rhamnosyltransferase